jgi:hypothetical protein
MAQATYPSRLPENQGEQPCIPANREIVIYMVLQPIRCTARNVATTTGGLLPHLFTLTLPKAGRLFSVPLLYPHGYLPVRKYGALRCPDFPPPAKAGSDRTACCFAKLGIITVECYFFRITMVAP